MTACADVCPAAALPSCLLMQPSSSAMTEEGDDLTPTAAAFCAGLLEHLPGLLCWTAPSVHSYARLAPNCWSGAYAIWGWDNREAPLRVTCPGDASSLNVEYKAFDGSTNPHLALAAMVATGMLGVWLSVWGSV
jgi:glutamine synthetase